MALNRAIAIVDLSSHEIEIKKIPQRLRELYLGGKGIDMYLMYNLLEPGIDPLDPKNILLLSAGVLTATPAPVSTRIHMVGKSPSSGVVESVYIGGFLGPELRFAGFDHLVIRGRAYKPVYLWVHNGEVEIRDAFGLWDTDSMESQTIIREELNDEDVQVVSIEAVDKNIGEHANIRVGTAATNTIRNTGIGSLMGSKNLKAVAIRGTIPVWIADPDKALRHCIELIESVHSCQRSDKESDHPSAAWNLFCKELLSALVDALGICKFQAIFLYPDVFGWEEYGRLLEIVTGLKYTPEQVMEVGERIYNIRHLLYIREKSLHEEESDKGRRYPMSLYSDIMPVQATDRQRFEEMVSEYYEIHGWDMNGKPKADTLKRLGLDKEPSRML